MSWAGGTCTGHAILVLEGSWSASRFVFQLIRCAALVYVCCSCHYGGRSTPVVISGHFIHVLAASFLLHLGVGSPFLQAYSCILRLRRRHIVMGLWLQVQMCSSCSSRWACSMGVVISFLAAYIRCVLCACLPYNLTCSRVASASFWACCLHSAWAYSMVLLGSSVRSPSLIACISRTGALPVLSGHHVIGCKLSQYLTALLANVIAWWFGPCSWILPALW